MYYLAIDPGEKRTGWASFAENGDTISMGRIDGDADTFMDWIESLDTQPKVIIYENYRVSPTINHGFSKVLTSQLIGMIKRHAKKNNIKIYEQPNTVLKIGLKMAGFYKTYYKADGSKIKHVDDQVSALAHGIYWLQAHGKRKPRIAP